VVAGVSGCIACFRDRLSHLGRWRALPDLRAAVVRAPLPFEARAGAPRSVAGLRFTALRADSHVPLVPVHALRDSRSLERVNIDAMESVLMWRFFSCSLLLVLLLSSCGMPGSGNDTKPKGKTVAFSGTPTPPKFRTNDAGKPVAPGGNGPAQTPGMHITPEDELVFTDPDNPEAELPELSSVVKRPNKRRDLWEESETIAKQRAVREGKPLLIWFTDSARSPMCKALDQELFSTPAFKGWASEKLVLLRVDSNVQVNDANLSMDDEATRRSEIKSYVAQMKKRYKVLGHPSVMLLNPSGEVITPYRGFKRGQADYFWGLIKHGEAVSAKAYKSWREGLEKKGYREWRDRSDRKLFAKLARYSDGTLILIEPDGTRCRTQENKLSDSDRAWIAEQKRFRGM
jgi:hypothetical protein